jgi:hypothetical protein
MAGKKSSLRRVRKAAAETETVEVSEDLHRVIIEGRVARMQTFNLPHEIYCARKGKCSCSMQTVVTSVYSKVDKGVTRHTAAAQKRVNSSLTVRFRQRVAVPKAALACPEVKAALNQKWLRVRS